MRVGTQCVCVVSEERLTGACATLLTNTTCAGARRSLSGDNTFWDVWHIAYSIIYHGTKRCHDDDDDLSKKSNIEQVVNARYATIQGMRCFNYCN